MPKGWSSTKLEVEVPNMDEVDKKIKLEEDKIQEQKKLSVELTLQETKLEQLIKNRKEFENKVAREKEKLKKKN